MLSKRKYEQEVVYKFNLSCVTWSVCTGFVWAEMHFRTMPNIVDGAFCEKS